MGGILVLRLSSYFKTNFFSLTNVAMKFSQSFLLSIVYTHIMKEWKTHLHNLALQI